MRASYALLLLALSCGAAWADSLSAPSAPVAVLPATYTVASLPRPEDNAGRYAFVTDLGGGADMVLSDGAYWKHIRVGVVTDVLAMKSVTITPLTSPPTMRLVSSSSILSLAMTVNIATSNLYPGYTLRVIVPSGLMGLGSTLGVAAGGGVVLPVLNGTWSDFMWSGTALIKTAGGTL